MSQLESLFQQQSLRRHAPSEGPERGQPLIEFDSSFGRCAARIERVREVIETPEVVPYPEVKDGHLGVVNVRGQIIPVVGRAAPRPSQKKAASEEISKRLVIFEFEPGRAFAVPVTKVHKIVYDQELSQGRVLNLGDAPARFVDEESFFFERGGAA